MESTAVLTLRIRLMLLFCLASALLIQGCDRISGTQKLQFKTEYQAVFLANGQVYFGKAENGPDYVTLTDVFYIQSQANPENKQVKNILVKRGQEWHGPDIMYISTKAVALIEPVSPESQVAKLINEAQKSGGKS